MYKRIDIGGKPIELTSNAATPRLFKKVFGKDLLVEFSHIDTQDLQSESGFQTLEIVKELGYVLNRQATLPFRECYAKLDEVDYLEWLTQFEEEDFYSSDTLIEIIGVWQKSARSSVQAKNQVSPQ